MTAKVLLKTIIRLRKKIDNKELRIKILIEKATKASPSLNGMPRNPSPDPSPMATAICEKIDLEREVEEIKNERNALINKIDLLENEDHKKLLLLRYVEEERWEEIMARMHYAPSWTYELHRNAIAELDDLLKRP